MILHIFNSTIVSGPEMLVLPALKNLGQEVQIVCLKELRREEEADRVSQYARGLGYTVHDIPVAARNDRQAKKQLAALFAKINPSIVHAHDVKASYYTLCATQLLTERNFKLVSTHHGVRGRKGIKLKLYEQFYTRRVLPHFDQVYAVCTSDRNLLIRRGLSEDKVKLHLNGVNRKFIAPENRSEVSKRLRESWGLPKMGINGHAVILGVVGRLSPEKKIDRILKSISYLPRSTQNDWKLLIFGSGPLELELRALANKLGLSDTVVWMGYRQGLGDELCALDLLLSLSDAEGLPINLLEAAWAGTPVFATAVDGILDLIPSPEYGQLVASTSSAMQIGADLGELLSNPSKLRQLGEALQARVRMSFSEQKWLERLAELYQAPRKC